MKFLKRTLLLLLVALVIIQFFRPEKNISASPSPNDITKNFSVPADVGQILAVSCNDCHSNNTRYPWYHSIQPVAWWLHDHVTEGKRHLNFNKYGMYNLRRQYHKFEEIIEMVKQDEMPLPSYLIGHRDAELSPEQKDKIITWSNDCMNVMKNMYPVDSLVRK